MDYSQKSKEFSIRSGVHFIHGREKLTNPNKANEVNMNTPFHRPVSHDDINQIIKGGARPELR